MRQLQPIGLGPVAAFLLATAIATQTFAQDKPLLLFGKINPQSSWGSIVGFSTDGTHLIARGDDQAVRLWNLESLQCDMELESSYDNDRSTCLSHDGRYLVTPMPTEPMTASWSPLDAMAPSTPGMRTAACNCANYCKPMSTCNT